MKRGWGTCGMFKAFNIIYLHVFCAGMVYIALWYVHVHVHVHVLGQKHNITNNGDT